MRISTSDFLQTKPGDQQPSKNATTSRHTQDETMASQVDLSLSRNGSNVSGITESDTYSLTSSELLHSKNTTEVDTTAKDMIEGGGVEEGDLFSALDGVQLEQLIKDPSASALASMQLIRASKKDSKKEVNKKTATAAPKIFSSDAANNYYNAMRKSGIKETKSYSKVKDSGKKANTNSKANKSKKKEEEAFGKLVSEALTVATTPETEESSQYLRTHGDNKISVGDKKAVNSDQQSFDSNGSQKGDAESKTSPPLTIASVRSMEDTLSTAGSLTAAIGKSLSMEEMSVMTEYADDSNLSIFDDRHEPSIADYPSLEGEGSKMPNATRSDETAQEEATEVIFEESIEHDLESFVSVADTPDDASNESGILHAIKVNDELSQIGSFALSSSTKNKQKDTRQTVLHTSWNNDDDESDTPGISRAIKVNDALSHTGPFKLSSNTNGKNYSSPERDSDSGILSTSPALSLSPIDTKKNQKEVLQPPQQELTDAASNGDDGSDASGIFHAIKVNDALSRTGSFAMTSNTQKSDATSSKKNIIGRIRSFDIGHLLSSNNAEKKNKEASQPLLQTFGNTDDDGSDKSGISHALKVNDALSLTGSSIILASSKKNELSKKGTRGITSINHAFIKKKEVVQSPPLNSSIIATMNEEQIKSIPIGDMGDTRSMSFNLLRMKDESTTEEVTFEKSDDVSDVSTAASSCSSSSAGPVDVFPTSDATIVANSTDTSLSSSKKKSSRKAKLAKKMNGALPPRIPLRKDCRPTEQHQLQMKIVTSSGDDGSIECSL